MERCDGQPGGSRPPSDVAARLTFYRNDRTEGVRKEESAWRLRLHLGQFITCG